jgi:diaminopimelate decarboxylase
MASSYNHLPRPPVVAVSDGGARVLLRRESVNDLLALDVAATESGFSSH